MYLILLLSYLNVGNLVLAGCYVLCYLGKGGGLWFSVDLGYPSWLGLGSGRDRYLHDLV